MHRLFGVIKKSLKEQLRSFWILLLTICTAPFFVLVYNLISQSYAPVYEVLILNNDHGAGVGSGSLSLGDSLVSTLQHKENQGWKIATVNSRDEGEKKLKNKKADLLMIIPADFSEQLISLVSGLKQNDKGKPVDLEFIGNISDINYIITAMLTYGSVSDFVTLRTGLKSLFNFIETPLGSSGNLTDFEMAVPGLVIFSIIMLMLTASVAMIAEVENRTMIRLKLSKISSLELMGGITIIQILVGFFSVLVTLGTAAALGFRFQGAFLPVFLVVLLTTISIIAFSLFIAAFSKTVTQVLVIGNFPLFVFMFFTGSMFPIHVSPWFSLGGYPVSLVSLMSPTHAVSALNKLLIMQQDLQDVVPELIWLIVLCLVYFILGLGIFRRRHMR
jgi:ABC-2 type transport system permease protein